MITNEGNLGFTTDEHTTEYQGHGYKFDNIDLNTPDIKVLWAFIILD